MRAVWSKFTMAIYTKFEPYIVTDPEQTAHALSDFFFTLITYVMRSCVQLKGLINAKEERMTDDTTQIRRLVQSVFVYKPV